MATSGHFYVNVNKVARRRNQSAVASAAYQAGQNLTHEQQRVFSAEDLFTLSQDIHEALHRGEMSEEIRLAFEDKGLTLLNAATLHKVKPDKWVVRNGDATYKITQKEEEIAPDSTGKSTLAPTFQVTQDTPFTLSTAHRKALNKGVVSPELRAAFEERGLSLGSQAVAEKHGRRHWTLTDERRTYTLREHEHKVKDPQTGQRKTVDRWLDVYADKYHNYTGRKDVITDGILLGKHGERAPDAVIKGLANHHGSVNREVRQHLWNAYEKSERNQDARVAYKFTLSFNRHLTDVLDNPHDKKEVLRAEQRQMALALEFMREQFVNNGLTVDYALHSKVAEDGLLNNHLHLLVATRPFQADGTLARDKQSHWDKGMNAPEQVTAWRKAWADKINGALRDIGSEVTVTHEKEQDKAQAPQDARQPDTPDRLEEALKRFGEALRQKKQQQSEQKQKQEQTRQASDDPSPDKPDAPPPPPRSGQPSWRDEALLMLVTRTWQDRVPKQSGRAWTKRVNRPDPEKTKWTDRVPRRGGAPWTPKFQKSPEFTSYVARVGGRKKTALQVYGSYATMVAVQRRKEAERMQKRQQQRDAARRQAQREQVRQQAARTQRTQARRK